MGATTAEYMRDYRARNPGKLQRRVREWKSDRRRKAIALLGGCCNRCGFNDPRALQIDHVNGGGLKEWRAIRNEGIISRVLRGEPGYQLLCANCNWIKRAENGENNPRKYE